MTVTAAPLNRQSQTTAATEIAAPYRRLAEAISKKDAVAVGLLFTVDAQFSSKGPSGSDRVTTRQSIVDMWRSMFGQGIDTFETVTTEATLMGATIGERGSYQFKTRSATVVDAGTYEAHWVKDGDSWRIQRLNCVARTP